MSSNYTDANLLSVAAASVAAGTLAIKIGDNVFIMSGGAGSLVESWTDGTSFYRKYADGWIEQGGNVAVTSTGYVTVEFPIAFTTTTYVIFKNYNSPNSGYEMEDKEGSMFDRTRTSARTFSSSSDTDSFQWYACGY